jgi:hypothetical protein
VPVVDTLLLPLCVGLSLLGLIATGVAWRRGNKGRVIQCVALALVPIALYFTGLLRLIWAAVAAIGHWVEGVVFSPAVWFGIVLLGVCIVLWVVGGMVARRSATKKKAATAAAPKQVAASRGRTPVAAKQASPPVDDDFAEIEALLKKRGIE